MFDITIDQQQYKTFILTSEAGNSRLEVIPERGGIITQWQVAGRELFYLDVERLTHPELTVRGGNPILFPICGNLPDNTYTHQNQPYSLKQHGFARNLPWTVTGQSTEDGASLMVTLVSNDETRADYPFEFELTFTYTLRGTALTIHQQCINRSSEPMPFSIGFHPYFLTTDKTQLEFEIPATEFYDQRAQTIHPFSGSFDLEQDELDLMFRTISSQTASVTDRSCGTRLTLEYSQPFSCLVFWTLKAKDFYCLEPWTAPRNAMNTGDRLITLDPGASWEADFNLSVDLL